MLSRSILTAAAMLTATGILAPSRAHATTVTAGSSSDALSAIFSVNGKSDSLANQAVATGTAPPKYTKQTKLPSYNKTQSLSGLTLTATAKNIVDTASSAGTNASGGVTAISGSSIGTLTSTLSSLLGTALTVKAARLVSSASFATTKAGANTPKGSTSIGSLTISAPAFGIGTLTYSGKPAVNHVLYHSAGNSVVIYLNRQVPKTVGGKVTSLTVSAIAVHVKNYKYMGFTLSGDVDVATSSAH